MVGNNFKVSRSEVEVSSRSEAEVRGQGDVTLSYHMKKCFYICTPIRFSVTDFNYSLIAVSTKDTIGMFTTGENLLCPVKKTGKHILTGCLWVSLCLAGDLGPVNL